VNAGEPPVRRIALVRQRYNATGGAERFVGQVIASLGRSVALTVVTRSWQTNPSVAVALLNPPYLGSAWRDASFAKAVRLHITKARYDLVQSHERIAGCDVFRAGDGVHATWLTLRAGRGTGWERLGIACNPHHRFLVAEEARMFNDPTLRAVICNSRMVHDDIATRFPRAKARLHVIYNAVDNDRFHPRHRASMGRDLRNQLGIQTDAVVLVYVGGGFARKGVLELLHALVQLPPSTRLVVVGSDKHARRYHAIAAQLGIRDRVHWAGAVADVAPYYAAGDLFVLPTLYDPFPNAALEAMASGLPIVTSTTCGAAEIIDPAVGSVVDVTGAGHAAASRLAATLLTWVGLEPGARRRCGEAARERVLELTAARMAREYTSLYERILGGG
jgi:UDP-glucose:(heptosyl)LPS alpha-1,3-glucosyltransferase